MPPDTLTLFLKLLPVILALLIPLVAIVGGVVLRLRRLALTHETIRQLSAQGLHIPPQLLIRRDPYARWSAKHQLHAGAINVGAGLGLMALFYVMKPGGWLWAVGCLPLFIGLAMLVVWKIEPQASEA
jgi:hypothetical protein